jgi:hypothetical protein
MLKKLISSIVLFTFVFSSIASAEIPKSNTSDVKQQAEFITDPAKIVIPRDYGLVKSRYAAKDSKKLVIHIQDAHCNYEAQSNIIKILECLIKNDGLRLISVEGADGFIDTSWFKAFPDADIRKEVADYFMKKGEITGPELLSITTDLPIKLFGAETRSYYIENLNAFTSSYPLKEDTEKYFNQIKAVINKLKANIYSDELKELDAKNQDYESKKLSFTDYVKYLETLGAKHKIGLRQYENLFKLVSVLIYEKKIDFNVVDKERASLIDIITKKLDKEQLTELVNRSLEFKVGKIASAEYYDYLRGLAAKYGVSISSDYPNLFNYIIYNSAYSRIENEQLFNDIKKFEEAVKEKIFSNDDQRTLDRLYRHINILLGLTNIKLLNDDFDYYKANKEAFSHEAFASFINKMAVRYGFAYEVDPPSEAVIESMPKLEDFYAIAIKRDKALVDNTLQAMKKEDVQVSVLVTGGFHTEGISKLLEKQDISYVVVCPNITKDVETPYIKILTNQRTPLEEILTDTGAAAPDARSVRDGMLAPQLLTAMRMRGEDLGRLVDEAFTTKYISDWLPRARAEAAKMKVKLTPTLVAVYFDKAVNQALDEYIREHNPKGRQLAQKKEEAGSVKGLARPIIEKLLARQAAAPAKTDKTQGDGDKSFPVAALPTFDVGARKDDLLEVFDGKEALLKEYLEKAKLRTGINSETVLLRGMFHPDDRPDKARLKRLLTTMRGRAPPKGKKTILAFGGGSGLLASVKPLSALGAFIESVQSSVDDGGSTFKMVMGLIKAGYGWMPSPGDLANSIFKGFASADKLYKLLDDQGRVELVADDDPENKGKIMFYDEEGAPAYVNSFSELCKRLLARIVHETIIEKRGIGHTDKTTRLEDDFVYFASGILNVAKLMDDAYFSFDPKDEKSKPIIEKGGASIRNLVLLAAMDYVGLVRGGINAKGTKKPGSREPMLSPPELAEKFQLALDKLAEFGGVDQKARVSLSFVKPETLYTIHRDNVILIDTKPGERSKDNKEWTKPPDLRILTVKVEKDRVVVSIPEFLLSGKAHIYYLTEEEPTRTVAIGKGGLEANVTLIRNREGNFGFSVNDSEIATLVEPKDAIEKTRIDWINDAGKSEEHLLATDGTGMVRYDVKGEDGVSKPHEYEYKALNMGGKHAYIRSRLTVMQTNITETPNYSKIEQVGFTEDYDNPVEIEKVAGKDIYRLKPLPGKRAEANKEIIRKIMDPNTKGIVFGPGSFLTSQIPHFLTSGIPEVLMERRKLNDISIALVINPSIDNETAGFSVRDMLEMIEDIVGSDIKIDDMFTDLVLNKFDTTKLDEHFNKDPQHPGTARWYVDKVLEDPRLIDELGLTYFKHLINKFVGFTDTATHALSSPQAQRFVFFNDNGKQIIIDDRDDEINLQQYLEFKIKELLDTLYQQPQLEIRTDPGQESREAKKSRGPVLYKREDISGLKRDYKSLRIYRDLFLAGVDFRAPRKAAGEALEPNIVFMPDYISYVLGEIFGLTELNRQVAQAYDKLAERLPVRVLDNPNDRGGFRYVFNAGRPRFMQLLEPQAQVYVSQQNLNGFRRVIDAIHIEDNLNKNAMTGYGLTIVAGLPFGQNTGYEKEFAQCTEEAREAIRNITNGRVKFNEEDGVAATRMTLATIVKTVNFKKDDPPSMRQALDNVKSAVANMNKDDLVTDQDMGKAVAGSIGRSPQFSVKITDLEYNMRTTNLEFILEPASPSDKLVFEKFLDSLNRLPIQQKISGKFHITLGRIEQSLDQYQIADIERLYDVLKIGEIPPFPIKFLKVALSKSRSMDEILAVSSVDLDSKMPQALSFESFFAAAEHDIERAQAAQAQKAQTSGDGDKLFPAGEAVKGDLARIRAAVLAKIVYGYMTAKGGGAVEGLLANESNASEWISNIINAGRAAGRNLTEPITAETVLRHIDAYNVIDGPNSIMEDLSDYSAAYSKILTFAEDSWSVGESRRSVEAVIRKSRAYRGITDTGKRIDTTRISDTHAIVLETLRKFPDDTPMSEVVDKMEAERLADSEYTGADKPSAYSKGTAKLYGQKAVDAPPFDELYSAFVLGSDAGNETRKLAESRAKEEGAFEGEKHLIIMKNVLPENQLIENTGARNFLNKCLEYYNQDRKGGLKGYTAHIVETYDELEMLLSREGWTRKNTIVAVDRADLESVIKGLSDNGKIDRTKIFSIAKMSPDSRQFVPIKLVFDLMSGLVNINKPLDKKNDRDAELREELRQLLTHMGAGQSGVSRSQYIESLLDTLSVAQNFEDPILFARNFILNLLPPVAPRDTKELKRLNEAARLVVQSL